MISKFAKSLPTDQSSSERTATVVAVNGELVDVLPVGSSSVIGNLPLVGSVELGDQVVLQRTGNKRVVIGKNSKSMSAGGTVVYQDVSVTGVTDLVAISNLSAATYIVASPSPQIPNALVADQGNLIVLSQIGSNLNVAVDSTKLEVSGGKLIKSGAGTVTIDAGPSVTMALGSSITLDGHGYSINFPAAGNAAIGAGSLSVSSSNNDAIAGHTHAIVTGNTYTNDAHIMATDSSGRFAVRSMGLMSPPQSGWSFFNNSSDPSFFATNVAVGNNTAGVNAARFRSVSSGVQGEFAYNDTTYIIIGVSSTGATSIANTGINPALSHLNLNPGGGTANVSVGNGVPTPTSKFEINSTWGQLSLNYSSDFKATHSVTSVGLYTIANSATDTSQAHIKILPASGQVAINGSVDVNQQEQLRLISDSVSTSYASFDLASTGYLLISNSSASGTPNIMIRPKGNLGVGTTVQPTTKLEVEAVDRAQLKLLNAAHLYTTFFHDTSGNLQISNNDSSKLINFQTNVTIATTIGSSSFASGFAGSGWRIDYNVSAANQASAEFDSLTVRGRMRVYELLINRIRATNGSLFVTSVGKVKTAVKFGNYSGGELWDIFFEQDDIGNPSSFHINHGFLEGDLIRAQQRSAAASPGTFIYQSNCQVAAVYNTNAVSVMVPSGTDVPAAGMEYVRLGSATDSTRRGTIYLTSDDSNSPFMDIIDGVTSFSDWGTFGKLKARIGKLSGITDPTWGVLSGYGIYTNNGYFTGKINANSGFIAGINFDASKIWVGVGSHGADGTNYYIDSSGNFSLGSRFVWTPGGLGTLSIKDASIDLYRSGVLMLKINASNPSIAIGFAASVMTYSSDDTGIWMGYEPFAWKFRVGTNEGGILTKGISWDGASLNVVGNVMIGPGGNAGYGVNIGATNLMLRFEGDTTGTGGQASSYASISYSPGKFGKALAIGPASTNLFTQGSFEIAIAPTTSANITTTQQQNGIFNTYSMRLVNTGGGDSFVLWTITPGGGNVANRTFTLSFWARSTGADTVNYSWLGFDTNGGTAYGTNNYNVAFTKEWKRYTYTYTFPAGATVTGVRVILRPSTSTSIGIEYDGVQFEEKAYSTPYLDGSMGPGFSWSGTAYGSSSTRVQSALIYGGKVLNPFIGTFSCWVNPENSGTTRAILSGSTNSALYIGLTTVNGISVTRKNVDNVATGVGLVSPSQWSLITVTWSDTAVKVYINGALIGTYSAVGTFSQHGNIYIGTYDSGTNLPYAGLIDDLFILDRVLSDEEVLAVYKSNMPVATGIDGQTLYLYGNNTQGFIRANATGIFGYNSVSQASGTGAFALSTTSGTSFDGQTLDAGDVMLGSASSSKNNLYYDNDTGVLSMRRGTTDRFTVDANGVMWVGAELRINSVGSGAILAGSGNVAGTPGVAGSFSGIMLSGAGGSYSYLAGYNLMNPQWVVDNNGVFSAGAGAVSLDANGINVKSPDSYAGRAAIKFTSTLYPNASTVEMYHNLDTGAGNSYLNIWSKRPSGSTYYSAVKIDTWQSNGNSGASMTMYGAGEGAFWIDVAANTRIPVHMNRYVFSVFAFAPTRQGSEQVMYLANAVSVPTGNPSGGGFLYSDAGVLKWRSPNGEITTMATNDSTNQPAWTALSFGSGWGQYNDGTYGYARYKKIGKMLYVQGLVKRSGANVAAGSTIATITGYNAGGSGAGSTNRYIFNAMKNDVICRVDCQNSGGNINLTCLPAANTNDWINLDLAIPLD